MYNLQCQFRGKCIRPLSILFSPVRIKLPLTIWTLPFILTHKGTSRCLWTEALFLCRLLSLAVTTRLLPRHTWRRGGLCSRWPVLAGTGPEAAAGAVLG